MRQAGCYFVNPEEKEKLKYAMFEQEGNKLKSHVPGKSAYTIAKEAGFEVPEETKILVVYEEGIGEEYPFSKEKLSPVLTYYIVEGKEEGIDKSERLLEFGGLGHSAVIHSENNETILEFSSKMKAGRIIVGDLQLDLDKFEVKVRGDIIDLTLREFEVLKFLAAQPEQVVTRETLLEKVWGYEYYGDIRTVDVTVRRIREKIEKDTSAPKILITKRGVGYYIAGEREN